MRKFLLICVLVLCVAAVACSKKGVVIESNSAAITVPEGWEKVEAPGTELAAQLPQQQEGVIVNVNLVRENLNGKFSASEYKQGTTDMFKMIFGDVKVVEDGNEHWIIESDYGTGTMMRQSQYFYTKDTYGYVLTFTSSVDSFDKNKGTFDSIKKSLTLK